MNTLPNIISASRAAAALAMLFFPVFSSGFWVLYCWGGVSDMIDGLIARKLNAESELGSRVDSLSDLVFVICSAILILPSIDLPMWICLWTVVVGSVKLVTVIVGSARNRKLSIPHSVTNRLTGFLLFCLPFAVVWFEVVIPAVVVCSVATISLLEDIHILLTTKSC